MSDTGQLRNFLPAWVPDEQLRTKILVDNPVRLGASLAKHL